MRNHDQCRVTNNPAGEQRHSCGLRGRLFSQRQARRIVGRSDFRGSLKFSSGCKSPERQKGDIVLLLPLLSRERVELRKE